MTVGTVGRSFWSVVCIVVGACGADAPAPDKGSAVSATPSVAVLQSNLVAALDEMGADPDETVDVIVSYRDPMAEMAKDAPLAARKRVNQAFQSQLLAAHSRGFSAARQFMHVPAVAGKVTREELELLRQDPDVQSIQLDGTGQGALKESVPAIGGDVVHNMLGLTGKGVRVAVLDTGIVTTHPDLKDAVADQHCFTQFACPPTANREGDSAEDDHGHGSNVAGIVGSRGKVAPLGFAPGAEIVAVKINDSNDSGRVSDWVAGLDWIFDNLDMLKVKVVNMSICSTAMYADAASCDASETAMATAVKNLVNAGVTLFAASGNLGSTNTMSSPACNTGVIAVAATYDSDVGAQPGMGLTYRARFGSAVADCADMTTKFDQVTCFSNTPARIDIAAPGAPMLSDGLNGMTSTYRGTSQASPVAAGVAALMLECNPTLTPAQIKDAMIKTAVPSLDAKTMRMIPSLRADAAVKSVCDKLAPGGPAAGSGPGSAAAGSSGNAAVAGIGAVQPGGPVAGTTGAAGVTGAPPGTQAPTGTVNGASAGTSATATTPATGVATSPQGAAGNAGTPAAVQPSAAGAGVAPPTAAPTTSEPEAKDGCGCSSVGARRAPAAATGWLVVSSVLSLGVMRRRRARRQ